MKRFIISVIVSFMCLVLLAVPVLAATMSIWENFSSYPFEAQRGTTVSYTDVYIQITNHNSYEINYELTPESPEGVALNLSQYTGSILPGSTAYVYLTSISVNKKVKSGMYPISVMVEVNFPDEFVIIRVKENNTLTVLNPNGRKLRH